MKQLVWFATLIGGAILALMPLWLQLKGAAGASVLAFAAVCLAWVSTWRYGDWANPVNLFAVPWLGLLGLYQFQLMADDVQPQLHSSTYLVVLGSIASFAVGATLATYVRLGWSARRNAIVHVPAWNGARIRVLIFSSFLVGLSIWVYFFLRAGGIAKFLGNPSEFREIFLVPLLDDIYRLLPYSGILGAWYLATGRQRARTLVWFVLGVSALAVSVRLARADIFQFVLMCLLAYNVAKGVKLRYVGVMVLALAIVFVSVQYVRGSQFQNEAKRIESGVVQVPEAAPWLAAFVIYTVPILRNVQISMENTTDYTYGLNLLYPVWAFTGTAGLVTEKKGGASVRTMQRREEYGIGVFLPYLVEFNQDFGIPGMLILPGLIGFVSGRIYKRAMVYKEPLYAFLYAVLGYCLIFSTINNYFSHSGMWLYVIMFVGADLFCRRRMRSPRGSEGQPAIVQSS